MGSNFDFRGFNTDPNSSLDAGGGGGGSRPPGNFPLTRQSSIYSLTFNEFQNTLGGSIGKDFGSMNMDELLKNIWSAEEMQTMAATGSTPAGAAQFPEGLLRQGSLTLPRTLSQKTVEEVWKDMSKELLGGSSSSNGGIGVEGANMTQRQQTLKEITLEEFLVRAGVVREDNDNTQLDDGVDVNVGYFGNSSAAGLGFGFQQNRGVGLGSTAMSNGRNSSNVTLASANLPLSATGLRSNHVQPQVQLQPAQPQQQQNQKIFPKQANMDYATRVAPLQSSQGLRGGIVGIPDHGVGNGLMPSGGIGISGLGGMANGSPANQLSSDGLAKGNGDTSSVSPVPYVFNGGLRGRRAGGVEKVVERRHRRMIKNRESAARSRARKQAYTMELEAEVAKLKEENQELRKKHEELMEMQKNQVMEMMNMLQGAKRRRLRRSQTGPW